jgi:hypothetical protein
MQGKRQAISRIDNNKIYLFDETCYSCKFRNGGQCTNLDSLKWGDIPEAAFLGFCSKWAPNPIFIKRRKKSC